MAAASLRRLQHLTQHLAAQPAAGGTFAWGDPAATPSFTSVNDPAENPDWPAAAAIGVQHRTFYSAGFGCDVAYCVYLPPNYSEASDPLPVIYNLHVSLTSRQCAAGAAAAPGAAVLPLLPLPLVLPLPDPAAAVCRPRRCCGPLLPSTETGCRNQGAGGNEFHSFEDVECLHEGIVEGRWPPMIMVRF